MTDEIPARQGLPIFEASRSHTDTPRAVATLWMSDQPDAKTSTWQHKHSQGRYIHASGRIRTYNPSKRAAAYSSLRTRDLWTQPEYVTLIAFPIQEWLSERTSMFLYTYTVLFARYISHYKAIHKIQFTLCPINMTSFSPVSVHQVIL
jgi:hypothetical protein